ncbi:MAG TPA: ISNCY family transposase [Candidatus Acidoferrales bacterium]|nr:ISNCY family transposase [Candidatus Acidoferrales bacterium]
MVRRQHPQRSVFEMILPDADQMWDPELRRIDEVLEDEALIDTVQEALSQRCPKSRLRGRPGTPAAVVLRLLVLKHLYDWSFAECVREVRGSLIYRAFCRIDCEPVPDDKTLIRLAQALGPEVCKQILGRLVEVAQQRKVVRGRKLRVDTTVVETNIHHPTDSSLLHDGVRVVTRTLYKIRRLVGQLRFRDRTRSVARRVLEIAQASRKPGEAAQARVKKLYRRLMGTTRAVVREARKAVGQAKRRAKKLTAKARQRVQGLGQQVKQMSDLTQRVLEQTKARVVKGDTHHPDKVLSMFETHTEAIRKGKKVKPTEFGKLVKVQEAENQIITDYEVCAERVEDGKLWDSSLERHEQIFGGPPQVATADAGFSSAANEETARARGVRQVALPWRGRLSAARRAHQKQRWFRRAQRWRTGCEGRISALKRRHGLVRCRYRGQQGMERWVGLGVIANNLLALARAEGPNSRRPSKR